MKVHITSTGYNRTVTSSVTGEPIEILKQIIVIAAAGQNDRSNLYRATMADLNQFLVDQSLIGFTALETIDKLLAMFKDGEEKTVHWVMEGEEENILDRFTSLMGHEMSDDIPAFFKKVQRLFVGRAEELMEDTGDTILLVVMISLD